MFNIWLHLLEGVTECLPGCAKQTSHSALSLWRSQMSRHLGHRLLACCSWQMQTAASVRPQCSDLPLRPACGGLLFQAKPVWHWAAGTLLLPVSCLSSNKMWKTGELPPLLRRILQLLWKVLAPFVGSYPLFTGYRASGSTVSRPWCVN